MKNDADMERGIITITENGAVTMPTAPVWMTQQEMCDAFNVFGCYIRKAIAVIYKNNELSEEETVRHVRLDYRICYDVYSLEMVIAVAFRLRSREAMAFRRFIMDKLCSFNRGNSIHLFFSDAHVRIKRNDLPIKSKPMARQLSCSHRLTQFLQVSNHVSKR